MGWWVEAREDDDLMHCGVPMSGLWFAHPPVSLLWGKDK